MPALTRRRLMTAAGVGTAAALATPGRAVQARAGATRVAVLAYEGQWPTLLCDHLARAYGLAVEVTVVATPEEARARVRRAALAGPPGTEDRASPVDVVTVGLEEVAAWRAERLLSLVPVDPPAVVRAALRTHGAQEPGGAVWLSPMTLGFDVAFGLGASGAAVIGTAGASPPSWSVFGEPALADRLTLEPEAAVWIGLRVVDPDGRRLSVAMEDRAAARDLFRAVDALLKPWRRQAAAVWTDTATFLAALAGGDGVAGAAWDVLIRRLVRRDIRPPAVARVPAEGAPAWLDGLAIPSIAAAPAAARRLVQVMAEPAMRATWASAADAIPADRAAWPLLAAVERSWVDHVLVADGGLARLWFRPALTGPAAVRFADSRDRFEFP